MKVKTKAERYFVINLVKRDNYSSDLWFIAGTKNLVVIDSIDGQEIAHQVYMEDEYTTASFLSEQWWQYSHREYPNDNIIAITHIDFTEENERKVYTVFKQMQKL